MRPDTMVTELRGPAGSSPFGASHWNGIGIDLTQHGYTEEEYLFSGTATVWAYDPSWHRVPVDPDRSFTTRVLVRRPAELTTEESLVVLEPLHPDLDTAQAWDAVNSWILRRRHVWVGVTVFHDNIPVLQSAEPERYRSLSIPVAGLEFDILGLTARAIADERLPGVRAEATILSGWSATGSTCRVFLQERYEEDHRADGGAPLVDGYAIAISSGAFGSAGYPLLSPGSAELPLDHPRRVLSPGTAVAMEILSEVEAQSHVPALRSDGSQPGDRYRLYQVAGTTHIWTHPVVMTNRARYEQAMGTRFLFDIAEQRADGRLDLVACALYDGLARWIIAGAEAPPGSRFELEHHDDDDTLARDADGNVLGGVRTPWVEVPVATYRPHSTPSPETVSPPPWMPFADPRILAFLTGHKVPWPIDELERRYGSVDAYQRRYAAAAEVAVARGSLLAEDAAELIAQVRHTWALDGS